MKFSELNKKIPSKIHNINQGDVVALIGDFDINTISILLYLIDLNVIIVPLTRETKPQHDYFFNAAFVDIIIENNNIKKINHNNTNPLIEKLRKKTVLV